MSFRSAVLALAVKRNGLPGGGIFALSAGLALVAAGCAHPSEENIRLRKINQGLQNQVDALTTRCAAQQRTIDGLLKRSPTIPMLSPGELKNVWFATGIKFGRLTGASTDLQTDKPGVKGLHVFVSPMDDSGSSVQAAGSFVVDAFDLAVPNGVHLGHWSFDAGMAKSQWRSFLFEFGYELTCPWDKAPTHPDVTIRVTFVDELTHVPYTAEEVVHIDLPTTAPASAPTTIPLK